MTYTSCKDPFHLGQLLMQYGWTPLHYASYNGRLEVVEHLLGAGAAPSAIDKVSHPPYPDATALLTPPSLWSFVWGCAQTIGCLLVSSITCMCNGNVRVADTQPTNLAADCCTLWRSLSVHTRSTTDPPPYPLVHTLCIPHKTLFNWYN